LHSLLLPNLLLIGVSLCEVLELVVSFPKSPSSLKMKFVCILYFVFEFGGFTNSFLRDIFTSLSLFDILLLTTSWALWSPLDISFS
jgi:hypothetical protein